MPIEIIAEFPLPSGKFAAFRRMTWLDWASTCTEPTLDSRLMAMAARTGTIDGETLTPEAWGELDAADGHKLFGYLCATIVGPVKS